MQELQQKLTIIKDFEKNRKTFHEQRIYPLIFL